jgi:deoxyribodipyrimidine photolyase-related protein
MTKQSRTAATSQPVRHLVVILGDQLDRESAAFDGFDRKQDVIWMAEVIEESIKVPVSLPRIAIFLASMRHFRDALRSERLAVDYSELALGEPSLVDALIGALQRHRPTKVVMVEPGEWSVRESLRAAVAQQGVVLDERADRHFLCSHSEFAEHARGRKQLRMEFFYREMRRKHAVLLDGTGKPEGGEWNYDAENRGSFGKTGPAHVRPPVRFGPDSLTRQVIGEVQRQFPQHVGKLERFDWPVTRDQALLALQDFIDHRLGHFGEYQDAMWTREPWLYHSRISAALNLKLLRPLEVIKAVESAYRSGKAPLAATEGFIRQILGWREYVRAVYWHLMPGYGERNGMHANEPLPAFFWTATTEMQCLADSIGQTLELGYAHHIQRLMVTGLFCLLLGVNPKEVHAWYLSVYVDAVEWVELPNTLGMSQYADGGVMASKPYIATGRYIDKMSNYCRQCRYKPAEATGEAACPFTTLYWDFLIRHEKELSGNPRMIMQVRNLTRLTAERRASIVTAARDLRRSLRLADNGSNLSP